MEKTRKMYVTAEEAAEILGVSTGYELFDEALVRYNEKQTRNDRRIDDYYEKIRSGKQEKPFHEIILQIGDKDTMGTERHT